VADPPSGQRNAIDGRIVDIVAEIDHHELWGATCARSVSALVAWKTGVPPPSPDSPNTSSSATNHTDH
jgi:hypothetical protein